MADKKIVGKITHFFPKINVAVIKLESSLKVGDRIEIAKDEEDAFEQDVTSMQVEHNSIGEAKKGDAIGLKVDSPVKIGAVVSKITE